MRAPGVLSMLLLTAFAAGCQDVDSSVLTRDRFSARADALCAETAQTATARFDEAVHGSAAVEAARERAKLLARLNERLRRLEGSTEVERVAARYHAALDQIKRLGPRVARAFVDGDARSFERLRSDLASAYGEARAAADRIGFDACGGDALKTRQRPRP